LSASSRHVPGVVERYLELGLALGRHIEGLVDAYYGPPELAAREAARIRPPKELAELARALVVDLDAGVPLDDDDALQGDDGGRRTWLRAQVLGLLTTSRRLAGEAIDYVQEVESCYGVTPKPVSEDDVMAAQRRISEVLPGTGALADRYITWRESQAVPNAKLEGAINSLRDDLRDRTDAMFGLPDGEHVDIAMVNDKPWSGFNYYLGDLHSRVEINVDLPVLSTAVAHIVAHEAYPGHHTEHCRKEVGLVRRHHRLEETIFLVGTPACLMAEGLADLGLEVVMGRRPEHIVADHLHPLGIAYDADTVAAVSEAGEVLSATRQNAAWRLHADGADPEVVIGELAAWALLPRKRAEKQVEFLMHPTWRAYVSCYVEGLPLCRRFVGGDPTRFARLITEQLGPADLAAPPAGGGMDVVGP
jgi:hypothetical protein